MATNLKSSYTVGSGAVMDVVTSVTVEDTRIRGIHMVGNGTFTVSATDALGSITRIVVEVSGSYTQDMATMGVRMGGPVFVGAPTSASRTTLYYG